MFDLVVHRERGAAVPSDLGNLAERVSTLEGRPKPKPKDGWDILQIMVAALSPIALAVMAYLLGTKVTNAINQRQLEVNTIKEMQPLVLQIVNAQTPAEARASAVGLAAYGTSAIEPLRTLLRSPNHPVVSGAWEGLRSVGTSHPKEVCAAILPVITDRSKLYPWDIQQAAIDLTGQFRCTQSKAALQDYDKLLDRGEAAVAAATSTDLEVDANALKNLRASIQNALKSIP